MEKMSYQDFRKVMCKFNDENYGKAQLRGVIVFTENSFNAPYTEKERSYMTDSDQKSFRANSISNSIFANCLDGKDLGVRLDWYMDGSKDGWKVDYCYIVEDLKA